MTEYACLMLPFPPSTNNLFAGKARRFTSKAYKAWQTEADRALVLQMPLPRFDGPVCLTLTLGRPDGRRRDLGNLEKAASDQLVKHGVLADDSLIHELRMAWGDVVGCRVEIERMGVENAA
jgi:crossover junction endodeoxyribonuclease RusA